MADNEPLTHFETGYSGDDPTTLDWDAVTCEACLTRRPKPDRPKRWIVSKSVMQRDAYLQTFTDQGDRYDITSPDAVRGLSDPDIVILGYPQRWAPHQIDEFEKNLAYADRGNATITRLALTDEGWIEVPPMQSLNGEPLESAPQQLTSGIRFRCPNCDVVFQVVPRIATIATVNGRIEVCYESTTFDHRCA